MTQAAPDAQLSPVAHHLPAAGLVVVVTAVAVGLPAALGDTGWVVAVALLQLGLVAGWVVATGIRGSLGSLALGGAAAVAADAAVLLPARPQLDWLLAVLGLGFLAAVVHQMTRPAPRRYLVASLAGVALLLCSVCALAVLLGVARLEAGSQALETAVLVVGAALLVGHLVDVVLPRPEIAPGVPRGLLGVVLAVLAATGVALLDRGSDALIDVLSAAIYGAALGGAAALAALSASYVAAERGEGSWALPVVQAVLPLAVVAPVAYALASYGTG
ncbi:MULTISPECIES: hypothetical protein [unclassified Modestobacter]|uniref:hypothetical protein n=1 Tax=unclassified Modestobacter TaxID=2643866 RepID=UPI0022AA7FCF|nr:MULTISPECIES: hypothetical protein [unclassified Modestobacter]MCZ2823496.1 hypothetical protein [Modestobacter sp. VKM Ac-2981]MCZ2851741.1 hypothetical protein [Modestobacter sp. VKM Ac-2982]